MGPNILQGYFQARCSFKSVCTAPHILANFSLELPLNNPNLKVTLLLVLLLIFFRASNCPHEIFSSSCAVFLGFYNVSISCHLTVKVCQIISDLLAVCLNETGNVAHLQQLNITHPKLKGL